MLRPLLLPLLGIGVIGSFSFPPFVWGLALLLTGVVAAYGLVRVDVRPNRRAMWDAVKAAPGVLGVTVLVVVTVTVFAAPDDTLVNEYELASDVLISLGFALWGGVFLLRLVAFAVTVRRRFFAAVLFAAYVRFFLGLFVKGPFDIALADAVVWLLLLAVLLWWVASAERSDDEVPERGRHGQRLHRLGLSAAVISTVAFVLAGFISTMDPHVTSESPVEVREVKDSPELVQPGLARLINRPHGLARQFSPVLQFTDDQVWAPIPVESYLRNADLHELEHPGKDEVLGRPLATRPLSQDDLDRKCPNGQKACHVLTIRCPIEKIEETGCDHRDDLEPGYSTGGTAYTRVVYDRKNPPEGAAELTPEQRRKVFAPIGPYGGRAEVLVQYWLFYYYDDWNAQTLFGQIRQSHEADWEVVTVAFDDERPLFLALSSHCGGTWVPWERARVARLEDARAEPFHTVVGVAEGSQANYYALQENVPPNWARCSELGPTEVEIATFGYRVRDRTGAETVLRPVDLRPVSDDHPFMRFDGFWGWNAVMHFETAFGRRHQIEKSGATAGTPTLQPLWYRTIQEIFCGKASDQAGGGPKPPDYDCGDS